ADPPPLHSFPTRRSSDLQESSVDVRVPWKDGCRDSSCPVVVDWLPKPGFQIAKAELAGNGKDTRLRGTPRLDVAPKGDKLTISTDRKSTRLNSSHLVISY